jgi:hypothetical protein
MADVDNPKTHVEDQVERGDVDLPRTQPESPHREGIDPLTEGDTMYPSEDTKSESEKLARKEEKAAAEEAESGEPTVSPAQQTVTDQEERDAKANTPNASLPEEDRTDTTAQQQKTAPAKDDAGQDQPQTATPANTNPTGERGKEVSSDASKKTTK